MDDRVTVFVNSTDSFEDCWIPFFTLFRKYWPDFDGQIVLNTETKTYDHDGLSIRCTKVADRVSGRIPWGRAFHAALDSIETPFLLYLQEDYFLDAPVEVGRIQAILDRMTGDQSITCVRLLEPGNSGPWKPTEFEELWEVDRGSRYLVSLQAGMWRTDALRKYSRVHESPWDFEILGSRRVRRYRKDRILCVNRDRINDEKGQILSYGRTGVVKGRWNLDVVESLFRREGIDVDFSKRGTYEKPEVAVKRARRVTLKKITTRLRSLI